MHPIAALYEAGDLVNALTVCRMRIAPRLTIRADRTMHVQRNAAIRGSLGAQDRRHHTIELYPVARLFRPAAIGGRSRPP
jgi:hypothetical protein